MTAAFEKRLELVTKIAKKCKRRSEFQVKHRGPYSWAWKHNLLDQMCVHMPAKHQDIVWSKPKLKKEALKYKRRGDFQRGSNSAYHCAYARGCLDEICGHMPKPQSWIDKKPKVDEIIKVVFGYEHISKFCQENMGAYNALKRYDLYTEVKKLHAEHTGSSSGR